MRSRPSWSERRRIEIPNERSALDLSAIPVGIREDGHPWSVQVRGTHILLAGVMGSGKSGVLWGLLRGMAPMIRDGFVEVWAIDPKGGMELRAGAPLFKRFAGPPVGTVTTMDEAMLGVERLVALLEDAAVMMIARTSELGARLHVPSVEHPHVVVIIDEIATLTAYIGDTKLRNRFLQALGLLLTQARAAGITVIGALQDPRVEVLKLRALFPTKIAMRLDEPEQVRMVLGEGARERGARCDEIPASLPGVGYVKLEKVREPVRVRAAYVTDEDIRLMAERYRPDAPERYGVVAEGSELVAVSLRK